MDHKDVAHLWEIGGGEALERQITSQESVFLGKRHVTTAVVVIAIDLSKPEEVMTHKRDMT